MEMLKKDVIVEPYFNIVQIGQHSNGLTLEEVDVETISHFLAPYQPVGVNKEVGT